MTARPQIDRRTHADGLSAESKAALDRLHVAIWVFNLDSQRILWANRSGLDFWRSDTIAAIQQRDFSDMSPTALIRIRNAFDASTADQAVVEQWTLYPNDVPVSVCLSMSPVPLDNGQRALLIEATGIYEADIEEGLSRGTEALRHISTIVTLCNMDGEVIFQNPAAYDCFGPIDGPLGHFNNRFVDDVTAGTVWTGLLNGTAQSGRFRMQSQEGVVWHALDAMGTRDPKDGSPAILVTQRDITAEVSTDTALEESRRTLDQVRDVAGIGLWRIDMDDNSISYSPNFGEMFGLDELSNSCDFDDVLARIHPDDCESVVDSLSQAFEGPDSLIMEFRVQDRNGEERTLLGRGTPIGGDLDDIPTGMVGISLDITDRIKTESDLRAAKVAAEKANVAKDQFMANMSHELRTPLNAVIGFSNIMRQGLFGAIEQPQYKEYLADIEASAEHLLDLINDILDVAEIEAGHKDVRRERVQVDVLGRTVSRMLSGRAQKGNVTFITRLTDPVSVTGDPRRVRQIMLNIAGNAIKFTEAGGQVTFAVSPVDRPQSGALLTVTDTGIGMSPEDLEIAMQPFGQVDGSLQRRHEGSGLGLPLTAALVEAHGGKMTLTSNPDEGTKVEVFLPATPPPVAKSPGLEDIIQTGLNRLKSANKPQDAEATAKQTTRPLTQNPVEKAS